MTSPNASNAMPRLLSIDVEDAVLATSDFYLKDPPSGYEDSVGNDLRRTLDLLAQTGARATFFVNARYCMRHDELMREIVSSGHTLASHGYYHHDVRRISIDRFRDDLRRSLDTLSAYSSEIVGYRPPAYTMPFDDEHLGVLVDEGIRYLSCGAAMDRTDVPHVEEPIQLDCGLTYIPVSIWYLAGGRVRYPIGYGHVSRLMPARFVLSSIDRWVRNRRFFQFYFHPYEIPGLTREQKKLLVNVERGDLGLRVYSRRAFDRTELFRRIFESCEFQPIESLEGISNE